MNFQQKALNNKLRIIFVTDIHLSNQNLDKLQKWNIQEQFKFDICLCGGDTSNCDQNNKTHNQLQMEKQTNQIMERLACIFNCKILFIPGNHDPLSYFNNQKQISPKIFNIHNKCFDLAQGLCLVGFGGSVPGYLDKQCSKQIWKGYPFQSNQQLQKQLQNFNIFEESFKRYQQIIIMTHSGPFQSTTSISKRQETIYSGASSFDYLLKNKKILFYLHGHTHDGSKFERIYGKHILNPGPLLYGQFCHFLVQKIQKQWKLSESHFIQL